MTDRWAVVRQSGQEILYVDLLEGITSEDHARQEAGYLADDWAEELAGVSSSPDSTMTVHLYRVTIHTDRDYLREQESTDGNDQDQD